MKDMNTSLQLHFLTYGRIIFLGKSGKRTNNSKFFTERLLTNLMANVMN